MEGDLATHLREFLPVTGHVQIAGVPERHEPDVGELNYPYLFDLLDALGYDGWVGCEYRPRAGTTAGLGWLRAWQERRLR
jgi:hydroxypyruvate isomerase